jgi:type VI protein secretion system component VasK
MNEHKNNEETSIEPAVVIKETGPVMTIWDWVVTIFVLSIPLLNIIMVIVWLVNKDTNKSKKNYIIASIIFMAIGVVVWLILASTVLASLNIARERAMDAQQSFETQNTELMEMGIESNTEIAF